MNGGWRTIGGGIAVGLVLAAANEAAAQTKLPSPADLMAYRPKQADVEYESPTAAQLAKCKVEIERLPKSVGYVLFGSEGQVLRRFINTTGGVDIDQWRYYQHGIEVYREIDTNKNRTADQFRWLNLGGTRWGLDLNEDGRIDQWMSLSAAEASREAVRAMTTGDTAALQALMVTADELKALGVTSAIAQKIGESTRGVGPKAQAIVKKSKVLTAQAKWVRFDAQMPSLIPADEGKAEQDLQVYENAMAVVELNAKDSAMVQIGELIRVGEVWKLTQVPQPIEGNSTIADGGFLMQPVVANATAGDVDNPSPELQKLIDDLQKLDQSPPQLGTAPPAQLATYNGRRADLLIQAVSLVKTSEEKAQFLRQCVDGLAAAVQTDAYPEGLARIEKIEAEVKQTSPKSSVLPYIAYRRIMSKYAVDMKVAETEKRAEIQKAWLQSLSDFVDAYPAAEDASEAMLQIAVAEEFGGKLKEAVSWYQRLSKKSGTPAGDKAAGAIRRLDLKGKPFTLSGTGLTGTPINTAGYRGKTLLVVYWATWCEPCKEDLPQLRAMYQQYRNRGFEVLGVNLDVPGGTRAEQVAQIQAFAKTNNIPWPHIYEPGGLDSSPAVQYGIISLPTMFLVDPKGEVLSRNSSVEELKQLLPKLFPQQK
jgi:thiol-disulfide isomerase/thioredoxin